MRARHESHRLLRYVPLGVPLVVLLFLGIACDGDGDEPPPTATEAAPTAPEGEPAGGTPASERPEEGAYQLSPAFPSADFDAMLGFYVIPGSPNEAVVLTQSGQIWRITLDESAPPAPFGDLSDRLIAGPAPEEGLLGLAFSPDFASDRRVFVHYTAGEPRRNVLAWLPVVDAAMDTTEQHIVLEVEQPFP
ncbi:MAG: hypothetical protein Q8S13_12265, partial [Dehalococcoidia bacterium]|nr:hypothetical protein [Dehalococcoidia bacterium]